MKKISLKNLNLKEVDQLSREQLKNVLGGWTGSTTPNSDGEGTYTSCVKACGVEGRGTGDACVTTDCTSGTCGYHGTAFWGCA